MLSIIICSVSPIRLRATKLNVQKTIGVEYEIIAIDNSERKWPIAKAYNFGASLAKFPYLLFMHEDVLFHSHNWFRIVEQKLEEPTSGVIGFAGSKVKLRCYSGWDQAPEWINAHLYQRFNGLTLFDVRNVYLERPFEEVVVLDGLAMFVRKNIWEQYPFDEEKLTGFHCYDIDFSLQIAKYYKNYVCCTDKVLVEHLSEGSYDAKWYSDTIRLHKCKWNHFLPMHVDSVRISNGEIKKLDEQFSYNFLKRIFASDCPDKIKVLVDYWHRPFSLKHFRNSLSYTLKYIKSIG